MSINKAIKQRITSAEPNTFALPAIQPLIAIQIFVAQFVPRQLLLRCATKVLQQNISPTHTVEYQLLLAEVDFVFVIYFRLLTLL